MARWFVYRTLERAARRASPARVNGKVFSGVEWSWVRAVGSGQYGSRVGVSGLADLRAGSQLDTHAAPPCDERGRAVRAVRGPGHVASQAHGARAPHPSTAPLRAPAPAGPLLLFALRLPLPRHREQVSVRGRRLHPRPRGVLCGALP